MVRRKAGIKSTRKEKKQRALNKSGRDALKIVIKKYKKLVADKDSRAKEFLALASGSLDKAVIKGLMPKNTAARKKARLAKLLNKGLPKNKFDYLESQI